LQNKQMSNMSALGR